MKVRFTDYTINYSLTKQELGAKYPEIKRPIGVFDPNEKMIFIAKGLTAVELESTLIHEIMEAINYDYGVGLTHYSKIDKLERALYQVLTDLDIRISEYVN